MLHHNQADAMQIGLKTHRAVQLRCSCVNIHNVLQVLQGSDAASAAGASHELCTNAGAGLLCWCIRAIASNSRKRSQVGLLIVINHCCCCCLGSDMLHLPSAPEGRGADGVDAMA
jgi:hypothetical protein